MVAIRRSPGGKPIENGPGRIGFLLQNGPIRNVAVPFDQRWYWAAAGDHDLIKSPHGISDRAVMAVDQEQVAFVVALFGVPGQMDLSNLRERKIGEIVE